VSKKFITVGVTGLAVRQDGSFLLTQRNEPTDPLFHLKWNIPGGGMEWGEKPEETLIREFKEELGVTLGDGPLGYISKYPVPVTALWETAHILLLTYAVDIGDQAIDLTRDPEHETASYRWFTLSELDTLDCLPQTKETVEAVFAQISKAGSINLHV